MWTLKVLTIEVTGRPDCSHQPKSNQGHLQKAEQSNIKLTLFHDKILALLESKHSS